MAGAGIEPAANPDKSGLLYESVRNAMAFSGFFHAFSFRSMAAASERFSNERLATTRKFPPSRLVVWVRPLRCW